MKIVKRTEPFEGAIYKDKDIGEWFHVGKYHYYEDKIKDMVVMCHFTQDGYQRELSYDAISEYKLIGKLGITHEIKDGRLVEIDRESEIKSDVFIGDIFEGMYGMTISIKKIAIGENAVKLACDIFNPDGSFEWHTDLNADYFLGDKYKRIGSLFWSHEIKAG